MSSYTLLTGATGLVGHYLLRDLLRAGHRLALVVRPTQQATAVERVEALLQTWECQLDEWLPRPVVFSGDVTQKHMGLSAASRRWIARHCHRMIHNAAVLSFHGNDRQGEPWRTNLNGTLHALDLCRDVDLRDFHYVSTAYVCGAREGLIQEDEVETGQSFRNDYEQSKFLAENAVRSADFIDAPTIYRPVVIGGDSVTGYTNTYHGMFVYLRLISLALSMTRPDEDGRRHTPFRIALRGDERRNLVPVDWVSRVICHLVDSPLAHGRTFHLAPQVPITARDLFEAAYSYYNSYGVKFCGPDWKGDSDMNMFEEVYFAHATTYKEYELTDPPFDTSNLQRFAGHLPCPAIDEKVLHKYWRFGEQDNWGKCSQSMPKATIRAEDVLRPAISQLDTAATDGLLRQKEVAESVIGLDVVGPGGGQWQIKFNGRRKPSAIPGLPLNGEPVLRLTAPDLIRIAGSDEPVRDLLRQETLVAASSSSAAHSEQLVQTLIGCLVRDSSHAQQTKRRERILSRTVHA